MNSDILKERIGTFFESKLNLLDKVQFKLIKINDDNSYFIGCGVFDDPNDPLNLTFSIPLNHKHFYFSISEAKPSVFEEELALLQHYSECVSNLCRDHSIPSDSLALKEKGYAGYVLVDPSTIHSSLDESIAIDDFSIAGIAVVPATQSDLEIKRENGTDALYEHWDSIGKDCVTF
jgi:hypothetical protein